MWQHVRTQTKLWQNIWILCRFYVNTPSDPTPSGSRSLLRSAPPSLRGFSRARAVTGRPRGDTLSAPDALRGLPQRPSPIHRPGWQWYIDYVILHLLYYLVLYHSILHVMYYMAHGATIRKHNAYVTLTADWLRHNHSNNHEYHWHSGYQLSCSWLLLLLVWSCTIWSVPLYIALV